MSLALTALVAGAEVSTGWGDEVDMTLTWGSLGRDKCAELTIVIEDLLGVDTVELIILD